MLLDSEGFMMVFPSPLIGVFGNLFLFLCISVLLGCCFWAHVAYGDGNDGLGEAVGDDNTTLFFLFG